MPCYIRASWSLYNALFQSCDGGSDCVCTALALLQVKSPQIMPDRPPSGWKIDLFNNADGRQVISLGAARFSMPYKARAGDSKNPTDRKLLLTRQQHLRICRKAHPTSARVRHYRGRSGPRKSSDAPAISEA